MAQKELEDYLVENSLPDDMWEVWEWFQRLRVSASGGTGSGVITETDMRAFFLNRGIRPQLWQLEVIENLDLLSRMKEENG